MCPSGFKEKAAPSVLKMENKAMSLFSLSTADLSVQNLLPFFSGGCTGEVLPLLFCLLFSGEIMDDCVIASIIFFMYENRYIVCNEDTITEE